MFSRLSAMSAALVGVVGSGILVSSVLFGGVEGGVLSSSMGNEHLMVTVGAEVDGAAVTWFAGRGLCSPGAG